MSPARSSYVVVFDSYAAQELAELIKSKQERNAIFNALDKLRQLGPSLIPPHMKPLKDHPDLMELRPRQGNSPSRLIYARRNDIYIVCAVSKDHATDSTAAIGAAEARLQRYEG